MTRQGLLPTGTADSRRPRSLLPGCGACGLWKRCRSPKMPVSGEGQKRILIVGQSPGEQEDLRGIPFVETAPSGELLSRILSRNGIVMRRDCWITNALRCHPEKNKTPPGSIDHCRPFVVEAITELKPELILLLGAEAVQSVIGWLYPGDSGGYDMTRWRSWQIPSQQLNAWVCPVWHPAHVLRQDYGNYADRDHWSSDAGKSRDNETRTLLWEKDIEAALVLKGRPWPDGPPDFARQVSVEFDDRRAADIVRQFAASEWPVAFDYETGPKLKPDWPDSYIQCCSLSDGKITVAFPWHGEAIKAMREFICSPVPKVAANLRHEARWSKRLLGAWPRNWNWDTVLAAHVLDNRHGIAGLKFQSFVLLGQPRYNEGIEPYLKADGNGNNRVRQVDLSRLCLYCGMDSLLEVNVSKIQKRQIKERS